LCQDFLTAVIVAGVEDGRSIYQFRDVVLRVKKRQLTVHVSNSHELLNAKSGVLSIYENIHGYTLLSQ
jgi:hypothetical protein